MTTTTCVIPWDRGVKWEIAKTGRATVLPLDFDYLADQVLHVSDASNEGAHLQQLIWQGVEAYEEMTLKAFMDSTWQQVLDGFPDAYIELQRPPLIAGSVSLDYVDADGAAQTLDASPATYLIKPSRKFSKARIYPVSGTSWPSTDTRADAVTVTYRAGYETAAAVPYLVRAGLELFVGERYQNRLLSAGLNVGANPESVLKLDRFWKRVY